MDTISYLGWFQNISLPCGSPLYDIKLQFLLRSISGISSWPTIIFCVYTIHIFILDEDYQIASSIRCFWFVVWLQSKVTSSLHFAINHNFSFDERTIECSWNFCVGSRTQILNKSVPQITFKCYAPTSYFMQNGAVIAFVRAIIRGVSYARNLKAGLHWDWSAQWE